MRRRNKWLGRAWEPRNARLYALGKTNIPCAPPGDGKAVGYWGAF